MTYATQRFFSEQYRQAARPEFQPNDSTSSRNCAHNFLTNMSKSAYECYYCGRKDFKSARGCQQHLLRSATCKAKHEAYISNNPGGNAPDQLALNAVVLQERPLTRSRRAAQEAEEEQLNVQHDRDATSPLENNRVLAERKLLITPSPNWEKEIVTVAEPRVTHSLTAPKRPRHRNRNGT